jgi:hypothetical protein
MEQSHLQKLRVTQLLKKFPAFYGRFINVFRTILSQMSPRNKFPPYHPNIRSNVIFPSTPTSFRVVFSLQVFKPKFCMHFSSLPCVLILFHFITLIIFSKAYKLWSSTLCSLLQSPPTSCFLRPNIPLSNLFSKTLILYSYFGVTDQVSHPYKTALLTVCSWWSIIEKRHVWHLLQCTTWG